VQLLDVIGVLAFALSGGLVGVRRGFDIFGILTLATVTALGGGIVRDLLLGITPPSNITDLPLFCTALAGGLVTFWFDGTVGRLRRLVLVADALGLGAFAVTGTLRAIEAGHPGMEAVLVGVITAAGGGVIRDVLAGLVPSVFTQELYALPALGGALLVDLGARNGLVGPGGSHDAGVQLAVVGLVFAVRMAALRRGWKSPMPPHWKRPARVNWRRHVLRRHRG